MKSSANNLSLVFKKHAANNPDKHFIIIDNEKVYTYSEVNNMVNKICRYFNSLNLIPGDIISAVLKNKIEYIVFYIASLRYGTIFNPYPFTLSAKDINRYLNKTDSMLIFCQDEHYTGLNNSNTNCDTILISKDMIEGFQYSDEPWDDFSPKTNSPACMYYSSGTTGNPKNILFSYNNMVTNISSIVRGFKFTNKDIHLIVLPLGHTASINYSFLPAILCGGTIILAESFWKIRAQLWSLIKKYCVTFVEVVPSILLALLNTPYKKDDYANINSIRFFGCGSSMLPLDRQIGFIEKYRIKVANLYGLSETGPTHIDYPLDEGWEPGSIGVPLDVNEVRIVNDDNRVLVGGEIGEIIVKGENVFIDYYRNNELYNQVVKEEFFHTGDMGYIDENDKHHFVGRKKELIIKGGINISPDEIDEIIYKIDEVAETLTVGKPDEYLGEIIYTYIVLKKNKILSKEEILMHCKNYLSRDKIPDNVEFLNNLPKGHSGKFLRKEFG